MFTGLIETTGTVLQTEQREGSRRIAISAPGIALRTGDSIAVSGVCLTAVDIEPSLFHADLAAETVARTSLSLLAPGSTVNLELPTPAGAPMGGHVVQGHVDGTGTLLTLNPVGTDWWLRVHTNLHSLTIGQSVNIEADVLIKFMEQREREAHFELTVEYLVANGY